MHTTCPPRRSFVASDALRRGQVCTEPFTQKFGYVHPTEYEIILSKGKKRTLDLLAADDKLGIKIIGWNKARRELKESFTTHIHDYVALRERVKAQAVLFIATEMDVTEEDREYAESQGARIWTKDELGYYEALLDTIGEFAKFEVIHSLGITKTKEERHTFHALALRVCQPFTESNDSLFLFTARPELLLRTAVVLRKAAGNKNAYQRIIQKKRLHQIKNFLASETALLPPNIIVNLSEKVTWSPIDIPDRDQNKKAITLSRPDDCELVVLNIPSTYASLEVIDGQHRLFGFAHTDAATRKDFNLIVVGISNLDSKRRTETFISINDNARRMDPNLVFYLKYDPDEKICQEDSQLMAIKVVIDLNRMTPFKRRIRLLDIGDETMTLKGFAGYDLRGMFGPRGAMRRYYPHESKYYVEALRQYFSVLKSLFPKQWDDPQKYIIFTNRGVSAFLKLLRSILKTTESQLTQASIRKYLQPIRKDWTDAKWNTVSLKSKYIGSGGWKDFHRDLVMSIQKEYPDFLE